MKYYNIYIYDFLKLKGLHNYIHHGYEFNHDRLNLLFHDLQFGEIFQVWDKINSKNTICFLNLPISGSNYFNWKTYSKDDTFDPMCCLHCHYEIKYEQHNSQYNNSDPKNRTIPLTIHFAPQWIEAIDHQQWLSCFLDNLHKPQDE